MGEDFEIVDAYLRQRMLDEHGPTRSALARIEAEHKRLEEDNRILFEQVTGIKSGALVVCSATEVDRLRADSERLRTALLKSCSLCHGSGTYHPECGFCRDSTHDHECPAQLPCTHPYLPDFVRTP